LLVHGGDAEVGAAQIDSYGEFVHDEDAIAKFAEPFTTKGTKVHEG